MRSLTIRELHNIKAGFSNPCILGSENEIERSKQTNGYVMGAFGAFLTTAIAQTLHELSFSIGFGIIGGAVGYLIGYSLSSYTQQ